MFEYWTKYDVLYLIIILMTILVLTVPTFVELYQNRPVIWNVDTCDVCNYKNSEHKFGRCPTCKSALCLSCIIKKRLNKNVCCK